MVVRCSLTPLLSLSPRSASDISTLLHFVKKSRSDLVKEKEKLGLFYDWTPWRRSFIQIHYCAVIFVAQVLSCCLYLGALWTVVVCVLAGFICRFRLFSHHPELSVSPLFCVCMPVFLSLCSIGPWGGSHSHLLIVTLTWWSHHRALFNRAAELESMLDHWMAIVSMTRGTYHVSSLFLFCPGTTESFGRTFSKEFWGNCLGDGSLHWDLGWSLKECCFVGIVCTLFLH